MVASFSNNPAGADGVPLAMPNAASRAMNSSPVMIE